MLSLTVMFRATQFLTMQCQKFMYISGMGPFKNGICIRIEFATKPEDLKEEVLTQYIRLLNVYN